ncbi:MAG: BlaI/MecI/CopY family transcriptional regulator [Candidatus Promineifilaceae bacterium]
MPAKRYTHFLKRPGRGAEKLLGKLELQIMRIAWERDAVTVRDVLAALAEDRPLAYTTVMTVMGRLAEKGWLTVEKQGRAYLYRATHPRQEAEAEAVGRVMRALLDDFGDLAVAQFVKELDEVDPDQLARLAELAQRSEPDQDG